MKIYPEDRDAVLAVAEQLDKKAVWWKHNRWISILLLVGALGLIILIERQEFNFFPALIPESVEEAPAPTPELNASSIQLLHTMIETQYVVIRTERAILMMGMFVLILAIEMFGSVMADWKRDREYRVFAALLRNLADSSTKDTKG